jgi:hypothetical protein
MLSPPLAEGVNSGNLAVLTAIKCNILIVTARQPRTESVDVFSVAVRITMCPVRFNSFAKTYWGGEEKMEPIFTVEILSPDSTKMVCLKGEKFKVARPVWEKYSELSGYCILDKN